MIAGLAAAAFGVAPAVDVLLVPAAARTPSVNASYSFQDANGIVSEQALHRQGQGLGNRGLHVEVSAPIAQADGLMRWVLLAGVRGGAPSYKLQGFELTVHNAEIDLGGGLLVWFSERGEPDVDGYITALAAVQTNVLSARPFTRAVFMPAPDLSVGLGLGSRATKVRFRGEGRVGVTPRFDAVHGHAELPTRALDWRYTPGSAYAMVLVGIGFGPS